VSVEIAFTADEMRPLAIAGVERRLQAMQRNRKGAHGFNRDELWQIDIEGLLSEAAAAKALGLDYVPTVGELDSKWGDVGKGLQVRSTKYPTGSLLIHSSDADDHVFILVTGQNGRYMVRGWIKAENGKSERLWKVYKNRGAYWVPQDMLRPMGDLAL
jgi:hypothetical protein